MSLIDGGAIAGIDREKPDPALADPFPQGRLHSNGKLPLCLKHIHIHKHHKVCLKLALLTTGDANNFYVHNSWDAADVDAADVDAAAGVSEAARDILLQLVPG